MDYDAYQCQHFCRFSVLELVHDESYAQLNFNFFDENSKMKFEIEIVKKSWVEDLCSNNLKRS